MEKLLIDYIGLTATQNLRGLREWFMTVDHHQWLLGLFSMSSSLQAQAIRAVIILGPAGY